MRAVSGQHMREGQGVVTEGGHRRNVLTRLSMRKISRCFPAVLIGIEITIAIALSHRYSQDFLSEISGPPKDIRIVRR